MIAILLAAGYGTRLYPLSRNKAKSLLPVGGRPLIDYIVDRLEQSIEIEQMVLVSNAKFFGQFKNWIDSRIFAKPVTVLNDGSTDNENRLGAVRDIELAVREIDDGSSSVYVLATDNIPRFDILDLVGFAQDKDSCAVFACPTSEERLKRVGVVELDDSGLIVGFQEKPDVPRSNLRVPPFYIYTPEALSLLPDFVARGNEGDAPGHLLSWLVPQVSVYALRRSEGTFDIGTVESYREVCREFDTGN